MHRPVDRQSDQRRRPGPSRRLALAIGLLATLEAGSLSAACGRQSQGMGRFEAHDNEVSEPGAGLVWERCSAGEHWQAGRCTGKIRLMTLAEAWRYATDRGPGWRLPTLDELSGLIDDRCQSPAIDSRLFPNVRAREEGRSSYWTDTAFEAIGTMNYVVDFMTGEIDARSTGFPLGVRLVRKAERH
jgi:hypothetical protein